MLKYFNMNKLALYLLYSLPEPIPEMEILIMAK